MHKPITMKESWIPFLSPGHRMWHEVLDCWSCFPTNFLPLEIVVHNDWSHALTNPRWKMLIAFFYWMGTTCNFHLAKTVLKSHCLLNFWSCCSSDDKKWAKISIRKWHMSWFDLHSWDFLKVSLCSLPHKFHGNWNLYIIGTNET